MRKLFLMGAMISLALIGCSKDDMNDPYSDKKIEKLPVLVESVDGSLKNTYTYDDKNRLIAFDLDGPETGPVNGRITYDGDKVAKVVKTYGDGTISTIEFSAVTDGKIIVTDHYRFSDGLVEYTGSRQFEIKLNGDKLAYRGDISEYYVYDDQGNVIKSYEDDDTPENTDTYVYDTTRKGIFRSVKTPKWLLTLIFPTTPELFSTNLVVNTKLVGEEEYKTEWSNFKDEYPESYTQNRNLKITGKITYQVAK